MTIEKTKLIKPRVPTPSWELLLDADQVRRSITRITDQILEDNRGPQKLALVGIKTRGEYLVNRISSEVKKIENFTLPTGVIDISLYRDDIGGDDQRPLLMGTSLPFDVDDIKIVLVDDVLYTARTVRAALDAIIDYGRPLEVQLAVLCDRGHHEVPIRADYVGKYFKTRRDEVVDVCLTEIDGLDGVYIRENVHKKRKEKK